MFYKLSSTCQLSDIENELNAKFEYPNLYEPKAIVDGLKESNLPIITSITYPELNFAIWGLLPEAYDDSWDAFQNFTNTLNTNIDDDHLNEEIYSQSLNERRCLIVVNGFFTSKLINGKLYTHHVHLSNHKPFCIAGIYNRINDGFLTCSLLVTNSGLEYSKVPNFGKQKPLILKKKDYRSWLNSDLELKDLRCLIKTHDRYDFLSHPIKENFYDNTIIFKRIVNSDNFYTMMKVSRN
jgi:putative SOS response-associated peptidase YedK